MPETSPAASAAGTTAQPGCERDSLWESSVSSEWAITPLASAASIGGAVSRRANDGDRAGAAVLPDMTLRGLARRQFRSRYHRRQRIEQMEFGLLGDVIRQGVCPRRAHIGSKRVHHRAGG